MRLIDPQPPIPGYRGFIGIYLLTGKQVTVVDPGPAAAIPGLMAALSEIGISPAQVGYIVLTHIHLDHAGGAGALAALLPEARVIAHSRAVGHLVKPENLWDASRRVLGDLALKYGSIEPISEARIIPATDGMEIDLGRGLGLRTYWTPGHAVHHMSLFVHTQGTLFAGEAAGVCLNGSLRPATPPPFKLDVTLASVDRLIELAPERLCYGHFGCYGDGVNRLRRYREKLLQWHEIVKLEAEQGSRPDEILTVLKKKDHDLSYLENLDKDEYAREFALLLNSIYGMAGLER